MNNTVQESKDVNVSKIIKEVLSVLNPRARIVIEKRFGLQNGNPQTLEAIGKEYKITRERVRQIEASGLKNLKDAQDRSANLAGFIKGAKSLLVGFGGIREERALLTDFNAEKKRTIDCQINFLLTLDKDLKYIPQSGEFNAVWSLGSENFSQIKEGLKRLGKNLSAKNAALTFADLLKEARNAFGGAAKTANDQILGSWIGIARSICVNPFGEYGLSAWSEIRPRGVRDKAYLVLKKETTPLHFLQISRLIEKVFSSARSVHFQTVHNELIKDRRFVLVGRGTYALREWGYEPGTVKEVIASILKKSRAPLAREEILSAVTQQRQVKELTVLFNLQNRKYFKKLADGRYALNEEVIIEEA